MHIRPNLDVMRHEKNPHIQSVCCGFFHIDNELEEKDSFQ
jgi:hypothetical protein